MTTQNINENLITLKGGTYFIKLSSLPEKLAKEIERQFDNKDLNQALKIVDRVYWKLHKQNRLGSKWPFSKDYKRMVGSNSTHLWKKLADAEIFLCDGSYIKGGKPKEYGINPELLMGELLQIAYLEHFPPLKKIERYTWDVLSLLDLNVCDIEALIDSEYSKIFTEVEENTTIKEDGSLIYKGGKKPKTISIPSKITPGEHFKNFVGQQSKEVCKNHQRALEALRDKNFGPPKRNKTNYRLNHVLTNFPSRYLSKCTIEGEELIEIDLKNSQFTLLANLVNNPSLLYKWGDIYTIRTLSNESLLLDPLLMLLHYFREKEDVKLFQEFCYNGVLYEELCKVTASSRKKVKSLMFALVFKEVDIMPNAELYDVFKKNFRNVLDLIVQLKESFEMEFKEMNQKEFLSNINRSGKIPTRSKGAMNFLAILLQRLEAKIFIDEILDSLRISGIKAISRHDSILIKKSQKTEAYSLIENRLSEVLGEGCFSLKCGN